MQSRRRWAIAATLAVALVLAAGLGIVLGGTPGSDLGPSVIGSGGGRSSSTNFDLGSRSGEPGAGVSSSTNFELCAGFWCAAGGQPIVLPPAIALLLSSTFSSGGDASSTNFTMASAAGETGSGVSSSTSFDLCAGFWCVAGGQVTPGPTDTRTPTPTPTPTPTDTPIATATPSIEKLGEAVVGLGLPNGQENSLTAKVNAAQKLAERGNPCAAANLLEAFINQVEANPGGRISEEDAGELIALAESLIADLDANSCPPDPDGDNDGLGNDAEITLGTDPADVDTDGDGCTDLREFGSTEEAGGQRDPDNPWDFYDTNGDGVVDLPNDILGVILRFSPQGQAPYDAQFDRGPSAGPNVWNMTAPDGVIDLPNDILGVIQQFGHNCV